MQKKWNKVLALLACLAMLCTLLPAAVTAEETVPANLITGGQTSGSDVTFGGRGLAFRFEVAAAGAQVENGYVYVNGSAVIGGTQYKVVKAGAVVTNKTSVGNGKMTLDQVNGKKIVDIAARYLCEVNADAFAYAVRIIDIPEDRLDAPIFARPYVVYADAAGNETVIYGDTQSECYNGGYVSEEELLKRKVNDLLATKHKLTYNEDGSFRVLILADAHMNSNANAADVQEVKDRIKILVDRTDPNLVIYTGDNTINSYTEEAARKNLDVIVSYVEEKKIPWCHVYGNHDEEYGMSKAKQQAVYESYEYCVSKAGPEELFGVGNYVLGVYNRDGSLGSVIYCLDSGAYASSGGGYDYLKDNQVQWYKETSELLQEYNDGQVVKGMMAFHIPLYENRLAYTNRDNKDIVSEWNGERNEDICSSKSDMNDMFETMLERGDIVATVSGHDHINDYMFNYYGIKLCNSPNISDLEYHDHRMQGSRVFDMNLATIDDIPTYVTHVIERVDPSTVAPLADNGVLEYTKEQVESASIGGYDGGSMSGTASLKLVDGKGVGGSDAIELKRSAKDNFEFKMNVNNRFKVGNNKYLVVWADFTNVDFRKACFGFVGHDGVYRTDDADYSSPFYYLPDGSSEWQTMSHGWDGCFGTEQSSSVVGKKGYFAFPIENFKRGNIFLSGDTAVTALYFYGSVKDNSQYFNQPIYFDDIRLAVDYKDLF